MKKSIISFIVLASLSGAAQAGMKYKCSRYVDGEWKGFTTVVAENKEEAERKAYAKYKNELRMKVDYVKCK